MTPITHRRRGNAVVVALGLLSACLTPRATSLEGARILFGGGEAGGARNIYAITPEGAEIEQLTFFDGKRDSASEPAWSPDGRRIAFSAWREWVTPRIYVMHADGSNHRLISSGGEGYGPSWSPRGKAIAFWAARWPTSHGVFVTDVDGGPDTRITGLDTVARHPSWRPVGDAIAYVLSDEGAMDLHIMDAQGQRTTQVAARSISGQWPAWHPREATLAFAAGNAAGGPDIHTVDVDGDIERRVTEHPAWDTDPRWSPDGTQILFTSRRDGHGALFIVDLDGRIVRKVTDRRFVSIRGASWFDPDVPRSVSPRVRQATTWGWLRRLGQPRP